MKKRIIAFLLASVMMLALAACGGGGGATKLDGKGAGEPLTKDDVIKVTVVSSVEMPVQDLKIWEYIAEGSGATLDVNAFPATDYKTKMSLMFATREELPDLMGLSTLGDVNKYVGNGLVALEDLKEYMPTYNAWVDSLSEEEYNVAVKPRKRADGKIYYTPGTGREGRTRMRSWLYREDIFKKHNLKVPTTFDELYDVCKKLKALYPNSYPFTTRTIDYLLNIPGSSFDKWWRMGVYYDVDDEEWRYGAIEDAALEAVTFYNKMIAEKLMPADTMTLSNTAWEEFILTDRGFIGPHLQLKIDYFNQLAHANGNTEFKLQAIAPPVANPEKGASVVERGDIEMIGLAIADTGRAEGIANAAKLVDWMYTDEAMELVSWGKEGETYKVVDGKKQFITDDKGTHPSQMYGFQSYGTFCRLDPEAAKAVQSETTLESADIVREHTLPEYPVTLWISFNDEEQKVLDTYNTGIGTYTSEMLTKFMLGQEPLSKFDSFVENVKSMGLDEVLAAYKSAYDRLN